LNSFLTQFRREFEGIEYVWFLEFQKRGAPHFHLFTTYVQPTLVQRERVAKIWARVILGKKAERCRSLTWRKVFAVHSHARTWEPIRSIDGAARYAVKYATKTRQKVVPEGYRNVGRFWGASQGARKWLKESRNFILDVGEDEARNYLIHRGRNLDDYDIIPKHIWVSLVPRDEKSAKSSIDKT
jgi:hypothetical protein